MSRKYEEMPREELISELKAYNSSFDSKVSEEINRIIQSELDKVQENQKSTKKELDKARQISKNLKERRKDLEESIIGLCIDDIIEAYEKAKNTYQTVLGVKGMSASTPFQWGFRTKSGDISSLRVKKSKLVTAMIDVKTYLKEDFGVSVEDGR